MSYGDLTQPRSANVTTDTVKLATIETLKSCRTAALQLFYSTPLVIACPKHGCQCLSGCLSVEVCSRPALSRVLYVGINFDASLCLSVQLW